MAKKTKEELINTIKNLAGETPSDEYINLMEDITDTLSEPTEDWEKKYKENDDAWRKRYMERFTAPAESPIDPQPKEEQKTYDFNNLFKGE